MGPTTESEPAAQGDEQTKKVVEAFNFHSKTKRFKVLDQTQLPKTVKYVEIKDAEDGRMAIRKMLVRGAPCIAAVGCLSLIVELYQPKFLKGENVTPNSMVDWLLGQTDLLARARPTAVNLKNALIRLNEYAKDLASKLDKNLDFVNKLSDFCLSAIEAGVVLNRRLGDYGADELLKNAKNTDQITVLTHCNTGTLATVGYGTALGIIRSLHNKGQLKHAYCTETRPYNQGSRLTAWELVKENIPATLIADSMVAYLMQTRQIDAVVVGADCVTANGDTANKIGTLQLAVISKHFGIPFYIAAPTQTFDLTRSSQKDIPIEERPPRELRRIGDLQLAPDEIHVWNPGFDVTPPELITSIITERGVCPPSSIQNFMSDVAKSELDLSALF